MILFHGSAFDLSAAHQALLARGLTVSRERDILIVQWGDGPILYVSLVYGEMIRQEAEQIGMGTSHAYQLCKCNACFEITFDDLDKVLDEINTLIETQITLLSVTKGFLFNTWNQRLSFSEQLLS